MNKKIIAVFCVVILMASVFTACGNKDKGYKLDVDNDGFTHAYATDAEGNTVLDEEGSIVVYQTEKNGEIATDENGNKKENRVEMPKAIVKGNEYITKEFKFKAPEGWAVQKPNGLYIAVSKDGLSQIQLEISDKSGEDFDGYIAEGLAETKQAVEKLQKNGVKIELKDGKTEITTNKLNGYYVLLNAQITADGGKSAIHTCSVHFVFNGKICTAVYNSNHTEDIKIEQVIEIFSNLTMLDSNS